MTLDPDTAQFLAEMAAAGGTPYEQMASAGQARAAYREVVKKREAGVKLPWPACSTQEFVTDGIRVRVYRPLARSVHDDPLPLVLFFHGGGWVIGDLETHDGAARALASMPANVVSVDYRLAPEHPYPAAHDDCWIALQWAARQIGLAEPSEAPGTINVRIHSDRLVVAGDSAGGLLAAAVTARALDEGGPEIAAQCLIYPALDHEMAADTIDELATGYGLTKDAMRWFYDQVAAGEGFSPIERADLSGMPPTIIATAGYDPLSGEALAFGQQLRDAGVPTVGMHFEGLIHGFFMMSGYAAPRAATSAVVGALRGLLA